MEHDDRRRRRRIWGIGLGAWVLLTAGSAVEAVPRIENDLTDRLHERLEENGFPADLDIHFSGQDGRICGFASADDAARADDLAEDLWGVRVSRGSCRSSADNGVPTPVTTAPPATTAAPATTTTTTLATTTTAAAAFGLADLSALLTVGEDGSVVLAGMVATEDQRAVLVEAAAAAYGAANVVDRLEVAGADGADTDSAVSALAGLVAAFPDRFVSGEAGYDGGLLFLRGVAADDASLDVLSAAALDAGAADTDVELTVVEANLSFEASASLAGGVITLTGVVASEADRQALVAAAAAVVGGPSNVVDELTVDPARLADPATVGALAGLIAVMPPNLVSGAVAFDGTAISVTGTYVDDAARARLEEVAAAAGVAPDALALEPRPAATDDQVAALEAELNQLSAIPFEPGSANLLPEAAPIIARVAALAKQYAGVAVEIQGHTDADGSEPANQALSERRAAAVLDAVVALGVPAEQLTSVGYGETRPVAPNDTPENKAKNRRVQFAVRKV
jgi:OOP family OmpA-OmpF porin